MTETVLVHKELAKTFGSTEFISSMDALKGNPNELFEGIIGLVKGEHPEMEINLFNKDVNAFNYVLKIEDMRLRIKNDHHKKVFAFELLSFPIAELRTEEIEQFTIACMNFFLAIHERISNSYILNEFVIRIQNGKGLAGIMNAALTNEKYYWSNTSYDTLGIERNPKRVQNFRNAKSIKEYFSHFSKAPVFEKDGILFRVSKDFSNVGIINVRYKYNITVKMVGDGVAWEIDKGSKNTGVFTNEMLSSRESFETAIRDIVCGMELEELFFEQDLTTPILYKTYISSKNEQTILFEKACDVLGLTYNEMCVVLQEVELDSQSQTLRADKGFNLTFSQNAKKTDGKYTTIEAVVHKFDLKVKGYHLVIYRGDLNDGRTKEKAERYFIYDVKDGKSLVEDELYKKQVLSDLFEMTSKGFIIRQI